MADTAPTFWSGARAAYKQAYQRRGISAFIPYNIILLAIFSAFIGPFLFDASKSQPSSFIPIFAGLITVGGFLGSVSVNSIAQNYNILSDKDFANYLKSIKIYEIYLITPQLTLIYQLSFVIVSLFSLILCLSIIDPSWRSFFLCFNLLLTTVVIYKTIGMVDVIRKLLWHKVDYLTILDEEKSKLK